LVSVSPVYQSDPDALPDDRFAAGELSWLVAGNTGRLLDARRTPVLVTGIDVAHGYFEVEILAFEDRGARWLAPLEDVARYQFEPGGARAAAADLERMAAAIARLDVIVDVSDTAALPRTEQQIGERRQRADAWLTAHGAPEHIDVTPFIESRRGMPAACGWLAGFLADTEPAGLADLDEQLAATYVSNPQSGDLIRAHLIVAAELGLCSYHGKPVRDAASLSGELGRQRRAAHIVARLGFVRALWRRADRPGLMIYRGIGLRPGTRLEERPDPLVSASLSREIAEGHFDTERAGAAVLVRTRLPIDRLFMTFLETAAMSRRYLEGEALLLRGDGLL
jgi:hypothetical protein